MQTQMTKNVSAIPNAWLFQGPSNSLDLSVPPAPRGCGGYFMALKLSNGCVRIAATKNPSQYVSHLKYQIQSIGGNIKVVEAYVSPLHLRYEALKRYVGKSIEEHKVSSDLFKVSPSVVTRQLSEALDATVGLAG